MKYFPLLALLFIGILTSCGSDATSEATNEQETTTTTNSETTTTTPETPPVEENTPKVNKSNFAQLTESTYAGKITEHHGKLFVAHITPKQTEFNTKEEGQGSRTDTLYTVSYLPFKDQELYLYQSTYEHARGNSNQWCLSILKNGETVVDEHVISAEVFKKMNLTEMKVGNDHLEFVATKQDGSSAIIKLPYDGKTITTAE